MPVGTRCICRDNVILVFKPERVLFMFHCRQRLKRDTLHILNELIHRQSGRAVRDPILYSMAMRSFIETGKLSTKTIRVRTLRLRPCVRAFVYGPVYVPLYTALCTCLYMRPCVRAFVCGPVYVPLCAVLCTSFTVNCRARRQVETKLMEPVVFAIPVNHYFV